MTLGERLSEVGRGFDCGNGNATAYGSWWLNRAEQIARLTGYQMEDFVPTSTWEHIFALASDEPERIPND
jgi:hypothetical protein